MASIVIRRPLPSSHQESLSNLIFNHLRGGIGEILNFITPHPTPRGYNFEVKRVKLIHFYINLSSAPGHRSVDQGPLVIKRGRDKDGVDIVFSFELW